MKFWDVVLKVIGMLCAIGFVYGLLAWKFEQLKKKFGKRSNRAYF